LSSGTRDPVIIVHHVDATLEKISINAATESCYIHSFMKRKQTRNSAITDKPCDAFVQYVTA